MALSLQLPPLLRHAPVAVASLDLSGRIVDANRALFEASGYTADELAGHPFVDFLATSPDDVLEQFRALASGAIDSYRAEREYRCRSGELREVELSVSLVRDDAGRPEGCLAVIQDVTQYRRALRDAARRAAELEAVIESFPSAVFLGDETGVKVANRAALDQLGMTSIAELRTASSDAAERLVLRDAATDQPIPPSERAFARALRGEHVDLEIKIRHLQTGDDRIHRIIAAPVIIGQATVGAVAIALDVTEGKRTQQALVMSEQRYRALVEQSPLSVQILAPDGTTLQVNQAWERLWGVTLADIANYNILQDPQLVERGLMPFIRQAFEGEASRVPASVYDVNQTLPNRSVHDDPRRWVRAVIYPVKDADGTVREIVLIHEDMTEQHRADAQRRQVEAERERLLVAARRAQSEAEAAGRVKDEFLAILSHELRTPLNAILGWARILTTRPAGEHATHAVAVIERNAIAQARLIDDLLDLSRIITGKIRLQVSDVDVRAVAADALESVRPAADARGLAIDLQSPEALPSVIADRGRLQQIFWNLLSNAVKFTEPGGRVSVRLWHTARALTVEVDDTGVGISPEILPFVFDRFTQGDSSSTRAHAGLGLGLAIARHLVELHGGTLHAESAGRGQGATFRFVLPLAR